MMGLHGMCEFQADLGPLGDLHTHLSFMWHKPPRKEQGSTLLEPSLLKYKKSWYDGKLKQAKNLRQVMKKFALNLNLV